jgi:hypothetical protein
MYRSPGMREKHALTRAPSCSGAWEKASFKKYNFDAEGAPTNGGALHPLMKVREEFRNIFFEMGYVALLLWLKIKLTPSSFQIHRDAHQPLRRILLLELRLALRTSATPCS